MKPDKKLFERFLVIILLLFTTGVFVFYLRNTIINDNFTKSTILLNSISTHSVKPTLPVIKDEFTFMIGGDMMFDRMIDYRFRGDNLVKSVENLGADFFGQTDLGMINLEGPISPDPIEVNITANNLVFNFPPKTTDVLKWLGVNTVSLANNHTNNNGKKGIENTRKVLEEKGISWIGAESEFNENSLRRFTYNDAKLSVITINILETDADIIEAIKSEKSQGNFVIVFPHWGNEYQQIHSKNQENLAHDWVDAGADLIIGGHPHVIQDAEIYKDKYIFYSLGNLLFDQTFSQETQQGLIIKGKVEKGIVQKLELLPTVSKNLQPELTSGEEKTSIIDKFKEYLGDTIK